MIKLIQNWNGYEVGTLLNPEGAAELIKQGSAEAVPVASEKMKEESDEVQTIETVERLSSGGKRGSGKTGGRVAK